ncbi:MAG: IS1 family transposase [Planctomycetaceae bacterium]|nr:IS1 family transposase [Planctomycetaceae bacterium]
MARTQLLPPRGAADRCTCERQSVAADESLDGFACPNPDCDDFNQFAAGNLSVSDWIGKDRSIRRLYCSTCQRRFSERTGTLREMSKLPEDVVVRIVKCLGHGCSVEATADICEVDSRTVERYLQRAGRRAADFSEQQRDRMPQPPPAVELDELHARVSRPPGEKKGRSERGG